jgi:hypothetical protein
MKKQLIRLSLTALVALGLSNCAAPQNQPTATIIHGSPSGGPIPIYVLATYKDLKAGGLAAGWFRGWTQAEYEFIRLDSSRRICVTGQTPTCRREFPIALVAVPKSYLTGEIPGSLALYHVMSGTGDLIGGAGNLLTGIAWFRGLKVDFSGEPLATATACAQGGNAVSSSSSNAVSSSRSSSLSTSSSNSGGRPGGDGPKKGGYHGGDKPYQGKY